MASESRSTAMNKLVNSATRAVVIGKRTICILHRSNRRPTARCGARRMRAASAIDAGARVAVAGDEHAHRLAQRGKMVFVQRRIRRGGASPSRARSARTATSGRSDVASVTQCDACRSTFAAPDADEEFRVLLLRRRRRPSRGSPGPACSTPAASGLSPSLGPRLRRAERRQQRRIRAAGVEARQQRVELARAPRPPARVGCMQRDGRGFQGVRGCGCRRCFRS